MPKMAQSHLESVMIYIAISSPPSLGRLHPNFQEIVHFVQSGHLGAKGH